DDAANPTGRIERHIERRRVVLPAEASRENVSRRGDLVMDRGPGRYPVESEPAVVAARRTRDLGLRAAIAALLRDDERSGDRSAVHAADDAFDDDPAPERDIPSKFGARRDADG